MLWRNLKDVVFEIPPEQVQGGGNPISEDTKFVVVYQQWERKVSGHSEKVVRASEAVELACADAAICFHPVTVSAPLDLAYGQHALPDSGLARPVWEAAQKKRRSASKKDSA